jgi:biopolymer transport protein ExbD
MATNNRPLVTVILVFLVALTVPFATGLVVNQLPGAATAMTTVHRADTEVTIFGDETIWAASTK